MHTHTHANARAVSTHMHTNARAISTHTRAHTHTHMQMPEPSAHTCVRTHTQMPKLSVHTHTQVPEPSAHTHTRVHTHSLRSTKSGPSSYREITCTIPLSCAQVAHFTLAAFKIRKKCNGSTMGQQLLFWSFSRFLKQTDRQTNEWT